MLDHGVLPKRLERDAGNDAVVRVTNTIDRLGQQIRSTEEGYTALQANLAQMLDTLRDGVLLFTADSPTFAEFTFRPATYLD